MLFKLPLDDDKNNPGFSRVWPNDTLFLEFVGKEDIAVTNYADTSDSATLPMLILTGRRAQSVFWEGDVDVWGAGHRVATSSSLSVSHLGASPASPSSLGED